MYDFGRFWIAAIHAMEAEIGPDGRQAAEGLVPGKAIAAIDALRSGRRKEDWKIVAVLSVARREYGAIRSLLEQPIQ